VGRRSIHADEEDDAQSNLTANAVEHAKTVDEKASYQTRTRVTPSCGGIPCVETSSAAQCLAVKILAVSDQEIAEIYDLAPQGHFRGIEMIVGCGDLHNEYLEYLVTILNVDLFYVPGNHDVEYDAELAEGRAAGCINLDLRTACCGGVLLAGFGGSVRYRPEGVNQYSQTQGFVRAARLLPGLWRNRLRYGRALDVLITHSPPYGVHDDDSRAHTGLKAINWLLDWAKPRYLLHGHMHYVPSNLYRDASWKDTTSILNVYPYRVIEIQDA
jgi:uncharacterized protein